MRVTIDTKEWKAYPKYAAAVLALLGFANFGDLVKWVRATVFDKPSAVAPQALEEEAAARRAGDSAILDSVGKGFRRLEKGVWVTQDYLLRVPQVARYHQERERQDSLQRAEDRRRRRMFGEPGSREARGPWHPDREIR